MEYALLNEEIGRSMWAQLVFNCQAPDAGNGEILHMFGTDEQKERFLRPLVEGTARSFFSMTEPEVSGADPTELRTTAVLDGDEWVIDGHKWFSSSAEGAAFGIVMAVTDPDAPPHRRMSQILVPTDTPGYELIRPIPVLGHAGRGWSTHCEVRYTDVRVPRDERARRAGRRLPDRAEAARAGPDPPRHALARPDAAGLRADVRATRSSARSAARRSPRSRPSRTGSPTRPPRSRRAGCSRSTRPRKLDEGDEARVEVSLIKFYAARVLNDVIDRAIQVHGARGLTDETPLGGMYEQARAARIYDGPDEVHRMVVSRRILKEFRGRRHLHVRLTCPFGNRTTGDCPRTRG